MVGGLMWVSHALTWLLKWYWKSSVWCMVRKKMVDQGALTLVVSVGLVLDLALARFRPLALDADLVGPGLDGLRVVLVMLEHGLIGNLGVPGPLGVFEDLDGVLVLEAVMMAAQLPVGDGRLGQFSGVAGNGVHRLEEYVPLDARLLVVGSVRTVPLHVVTTPPTNYINLWTPQARHQHPQPPSSHAQDGSLLDPTPCSRIHYLDYTRVVPG